jgi:hypothetical protein
VKKFEANVFELVQPPMLGVVKDLSSRGLSVQVPNPVELNALVQIELNGIVLAGTVRHLRKDEDGYVMGVRLQHSLQKLEQLRSYNRVVTDQARA